MARIKAVLFDLDGTLVHIDQECRNTILLNTLRYFCMNHLSEELVNKFWFESDRDKIITDYFALDPDLFWNEYQKHDTAELRKKSISAYQDTDFLKELKNKGYKIGIVTGARQDIAEVELELLGKEAFDEIIFARNSNGIPAKPSPAGIEYCLELLNAKKKHAIFVGNSEEDILSARNVGVVDILIDRKEYDFNGLSCSYKINSLYELREIIGLK